MENKQQFEENLIDRIIQLALDEDIRDGDHTSLATIPNNSTAKAKIVAKEDGVLSGVALSTKIFAKVSPQISVNLLKFDGDKVSPGDLVLTVEGPEIDLLTAERTVLNFMQRLSGIATYTHSLVEKIKHTSCSVCFIFSTRE